MTARPGVADELVGRIVAAGIDLAVADGDLLYEGPAHAVDDETLSDLRKHKDEVVRLLSDNQGRGVVALGPTTREQQRMALRNQLDRNPATYNVCLRIDLNRPFDADRLDHALTALVNRHETLRTRFARYGGHLLQEVMRPPRAALERLQPGVLTGATDQDVARWCASRGAAPFDLEAAPPVRWILAPRGEERAILLVTLHHITCDGWSIRILSDELEAIQRGDEEHLRPVTITPRDFAKWELGWLTPERVEEERRFWVEELRGAELAPKLPGAAGVVATGGDARSVAREISSDAAARMSDLARSLATTEFALYLAAFVKLLTTGTRGRDFAVVIAVANRPRRAHEDVVGLCRNAVPIRCAADGAPIDVAARQIAERVERAMARQTFPIGLIPVPADQDADPHRLPITFGVEPRGEAPPTCGGASVRVDDVFLGAARADLSLLVKLRDDGARASFEYATCQFTAEEGEYMADRYVDIVTNLPASADGGTAGRGTRDTLSAEEVSAFRQHGHVLVRRLLGDRDLHRLRRAFDALDAADDYIVDEFAKRLVVIRNLWQHDPDVASLVRRLGPLAAQLMGVEEVRLVDDVALVKPARDRGGQPTVWHQDAPNFPFDRRGFLTFWIAVEDVGLDQGPLTFVPGSHRLGLLGAIDGGGEEIGLNSLLTEDDRRRVGNPVTSALDAGDATVHDGALLHAAGPNQTLQPRRAWGVRYIPAATRYTGAAHRLFDGLGLTAFEPLQHENFPLIRRLGT